MAPGVPTLRCAAKAPRGEVRMYPEGHFAIYVDEASERVVTDQLAFLDRHLMKASRSPATTRAAAGCGGTARLRGQAGQSDLARRNLGKTPDFLAGQLYCLSRRNTATASPV